jgi:hypothetical protein
MNFDEVRRMALALPGVDERTSNGTAHRRAVVQYGSGMVAPLMLIRMVFMLGVRGCFTCTCSASGSTREGGPARGGLVARRDGRIFRTLSPLHVPEPADRRP